MIPPPFRLDVQGLAAKSDREAFLGRRPPHHYEILAIKEPITEWNILKVVSYRVHFANHRERNSTTRDLGTLLADK